MKKFVVRAVLLVVVLALVVVSAFVYAEKRSVTENQTKDYFQTLQEFGPITKAVKVPSETQLPAGMNYDPNSPYIIQGKTVMRLEAGSLKRWWDLPIDREKYHIVSLLDGIALFEENETQNAVLFNLEQRRQVELPKGPFSVRALGVASGDMVLLRLDANLNNVEKIIGVNSNGDKKWEFMGTCSKTALLKPSLRWLYECQNYQTERQEGGWVINAQTGEAFRPSPRPTEKIRSFNGRLYYWDTEYKTVSSIINSSDVGEAVAVPDGIDDLFMKSKDKMSFQWQTKSIVAASKSGLTPDNMGGSVVLADGKVVAPTKKWACEKPFFFNDGKEYFCGLDEVSQSKFVSAIRAYETETGKEITSIDGNGTLIRFNKTLVAAVTDSNATVLYRFE